MKPLILWSFTYCPPNASEYLCWQHLHTTKEDIVDLITCHGFSGARPVRVEVRVVKPKPRKARRKP